MATRLREWPSASSAPKRRLRRSKTRRNFTFSDIALWLAATSDQSADEPYDERESAASFDDASLSREVWDADGGSDSIKFRINQIAKRLEEPSLSDALGRLASSSGKANV